MLIFDFDGVLIDSVNEMSVSAYNTLTGELITSLEELPGNAAGLFRTNRYHIQTAGDGVALMGWCMDHADKPSDYRMTEPEYQAQKQNVEGSMKERSLRFFEVRKRFLDHDTLRWRALNKPYQPLWDNLKSQGGQDMVILTHKNREAVINLCHHYGLMVLPDNIFSGDQGASKISNFLQIQTSFGQRDYTFLDDNIENLRELNEHFNRKQPVIRLLLASWGYTGPNDQEKSEQLGYQSVSQDDVVEMLANGLG